MVYNNTILIIDMQNDFCSTDGALYVNGADMDVERLDAFLLNNANKIGFIYLTADSHYPGHIGSITAWRDENGVCPSSGTVITLEDVKNKKYTCVSLSEFEVELQLSLMKRHNKELIVWPAHCLRGNEGSNISGELMPSIFSMFILHNTEYKILEKGMVNGFEQYSALTPGFGDDLVLTDDKQQREMIEILKSSNNIYVAGEAMDYCVRETIGDICKYHPYLVSKMTLLKDCMSPIDVNFNMEEDDIYKRFIQLGGKISTSVETELKEQY